MRYWLGVRLLRLAERLLRRRWHAAGADTAAHARVYFAWRWNSPVPGSGQPPYLCLEIDDLGFGRRLMWVLSPQQTLDLCQHGADAVVKQAEQFGDGEPRDYDVRRMP